MGGDMCSRSPVQAPLPCGQMSFMTRRAATRLDQSASSSCRAFGRFLSRLAGAISVGAPAPAITPQWQATGYRERTSMGEAGGCWTAQTPLIGRSRTREGLSQTRSKDRTSRFDGRSRTQRWSTGSATDTASAICSEILPDLAPVGGSAFDGASRLGRAPGTGDTFVAGRDLEQSELAGVAFVVLAHEAVEAAFVIGGQLAGIASDRAVEHLLHLVEVPPREVFSDLR